MSMIREVWHLIGSPTLRRPYSLFFGAPGTPFPLFPSLAEPRGMERRESPMWRARSAVARTPFRDQAPNEMVQCAFRLLRRTGLVLLVADFLHPVDSTAVQRLLNGDMRHRGRWR